MGEIGEIFQSVIFFAVGSGAQADIIAGLFQFMFSFGRGPSDPSFLFANIFTHLFIYTIIFLIHKFDLFYAERFHLEEANGFGVFLSGLMFLFLFHIVLYFTPDSWRKFVALSIIGMTTIGYIFWLKKYYIEKRKDHKKRFVNFSDFWSRKPTQSGDILRSRHAAKVRNVDFIENDVKRTFSQSELSQVSKMQEQGGKSARTVTPQGSER